MLLIFNLKFKKHSKKGKILGNVSRYSIACESFNQSILENNKYNEENIETEDDMRKYFEQFSNVDRSGFKVIGKRIYKGYMDDARNTVSFIQKLILIF